MRKQVPIRWRRMTTVSRAEHKTRGHNDWRIRIEVTTRKAQAQDLEAALASRRLIKLGLKSHRLAITRAGSEIVVSSSLPTDIVRAQPHIVDVVGTSGIGATISGIQRWRGPEAGWEVRYTDLAGDWLEEWITPALGLISFLTFIATLIWLLVRLILRF
jgi:hypothetical protein